jgi:hypothetical protein
MLQASVSNVSSIFQMHVASVFIVMLHMFHTMLQVFYFDVAYVCNGFQVFFSRVFASVSRTCFKCFICLFCLLAFYCLALVSPRLLLSCILLKLAKGVAAAGGWRRRCERTLSPSGTRAGSASVHFFFFFFFVIYAGC